MARQGIRKGATTLAPSPLRQDHESPDDLFHHATDKLTVKEILEAERQEHEAKTARLREARLAKEALEPPPAAKPRRRPRGWP
jgi:hypothetical protein